MSADLKADVSESYTSIIKGSLDRIMFFEIDSLMNLLIGLHIANIENADEKLVITDKFYIHRNLWKGILETLYEKFLPQVKYSFDWEIEITPYTVMLCELTKEQFQSSEIELQKQIMNLTDEAIERDFNSIIEKAGFDKIGLEEVLKNRIPNSLIPPTRKEQLALLFRLMNFPPLGELSLFLQRYNALLKKQASELSKAFSNINEKQIPSFGMSEQLHYSWFHLDHATFQKYGLDGFEQNPDLKEFKSDFERVRDEVRSNAEKFKDELICPCCGKKQEITVPEELLEYKYLLENQKLCKTIGLLYLEDFIYHFKKNLSTKASTFLSSINQVDNPECIILVEGDSEESSIPVLAFRKRFILSNHKIQVYNSKSKEKLFQDFLSIKKNYPSRKIICLLDSDAKKERDNIQRIIKDHKDQYRMVFIERGTFEDIFDLDVSVEILNELYPDGESITVNDFDSSKDFLKNVNRIMHTKKKADFDKVLFAKAISFRMDIEKIPNEIEQILEIAKDFTTPKKFIKQ